MTEGHKRYEIYICEFSKSIIIYNFPIFNVLLKHYQLNCLGCISFYSCIYFPYSTSSQTPQPYQNTHFPESVWKNSPFSTVQHGCSCLSTSVRAVAKRAWQAVPEFGNARWHVASCTMHSVANFSGPKRKGK